MADDGWIKLHRKLMENPIFLNPNLLQIFIYCLLKANHKDNEMIWNDELMTVKTGSFITGRLQMAKDLKQKDSALYKRLQLLTKLGYIELKSNNKFTLLTIVKYKSYQVSESKEEQQSNNKVTTKEQQSNTNNNDKNEKNVKKGLHLFANSDYVDIEKFKTAFYSLPKYQEYDYGYYYEAVSNWSASGNKMKKDWIATARNFALTDKTPKLTKQNVIKLPSR